MLVTIGVDVGGSHVACAAVNMKYMTVLSETYFYSKLENNSTKEKILKTWAKVINKSLCKVPNDFEVSGVSFAMPGPFDYKEGIAWFERNDKYESLHGVSILDELPNYLCKKGLAIRFLNDASAFGVSGSLQAGKQMSDKILALTIGTGFGASFIDNQVPLVHGEGVPNEGCLWDKSFKEGIADDYFSTRWFVKKYNNYSKENKVNGVKTIVERNDEVGSMVFNEFAENLGAFLLPYVLGFKCRVIILGGSIAKAHNYFLPQVINYLKANDIEINVVILTNTEKENIIGASYLFKDNYWEKLEAERPKY